MEAKLFLDQDTSDYSKIKKAIAILAVGSIFGLAGCSGDATENIYTKNNKSNPNISSSEIVVTPESPIETAENSVVIPEASIPEVGVPSAESYEDEQQSPAVIDETSTIPGAPAPAIETTPEAPVPPVVLPTEQITKPEQLSNLETLYGAECSTLPEEIRLTTYTILDAKNVAVNADGEPMSGLKDNVEYRIKQSISEHDNDARMVLTDTQEAQVEQSVSGIVDEDFGSDIAPDGGKSYYDVTFVGYASDKKSNKYDVRQLDTQVDGLPAYQLTDVSFCVAVITKTR